MSAADGTDGPKSADRSDEPDLDARRALSGGVDAVLLVGFDAQSGAIQIEVANDAAQALLALDELVAGPLDESRVPHLAPLLARLRDGATRGRATREQLAIADPLGRRIVVDVQIEPLPAIGGPRSLAVVRLADGESASLSAPAVGVFRTELPLGAVFVDDAMLALLGLTHEQALGHGWLEALHPEDRARVESALDNAGSSEDAVQLECRALRGGVEERTVRIRAVPVRGDDGGATGYLGSVEDLTEERRDREAGERLAEMAEMLGERIVIAAADLGLRYANPAARRDLALPDGDEIREVSMADLLATDDGAQTARDIARALAEGDTWTGHLRARALDGREMDLEGTVVAHHSHGEISHYSLLARDPSPLRLVEHALRESEERFRLIADSSPTGIFLVADAGLLTYVNPRIADIVGEPVDRVVGRPFTDWLRPDDLARIADSGVLELAHDEELVDEFQVRQPSGALRWVRVHGAPVIGDAGVVRGYVGSVVDISAEREARRELQMFARAVESADDLVTFHDADGRIFFGNAAAHDFFGVAPDEALPPLVPPDYIDGPAELFEEIASSLHAQHQWSGEVVGKGAHGRRVPLSVGVIAHRDEAGEIEYYSSLARDLTEYRQADAARRRSEVVLRAIVQASPLAIYALDAHGTVHVWNHAAEDLFGWRAGEVVGSAPPFVDASSRDDNDALVARVFSGKTVKGHRLRYIRRDGEPVDADVAIAPVRNAEGRVVTAVAVLADVTEQTRATQALVDSEVWFRSLVQHSRDMVIVMGNDATVLYASPTAREFTHIAGDDLNALAITDVVRVADEELSQLQEVFGRLRARPGSTERSTFRVVRSDGVTRWVEIVATNLLDDPVVAGIVVNGRDVTDSFEADEAVRASQQRLQTLLSSVSDAIVVLDGDGGLVYSSPVADEMFADAGDEPDNVFAAIDPGELSHALELWERTRTTAGVGPPAEVRIRRTDDSWIDAEVIANNLLDDPAMHAIVMTIRDITQRKASEEALRQSEARLRESEARYRAVVDDQIELVCRYQPDTTITFVNRAFADFYGRKPAELIGSLLVDLHPQAERADELERLRAFGSGSEVRTYDDWEFGSDGVRHWYRWIDRAFLDADGAVTEFQSVGHDVTEEHRAALLTTNQADILEQIARGVPLDETLRAIATTLEAHFPRLTCAVFQLDMEADALRLGAAPSLARRFATALDGAVVHEAANSCAAAVLRREPVYVEDATVDPLCADVHDLARECGLRAAWSTPVIASDARTVLGTIEVYGREAGRPDVEHRRILSLMAHLASIAIERKEYETRLAHESMHDPLTQLPNRLLFLDRLTQAIARGQRTQAGVAVLFLDLDRFKNVNDSLGHDAGDELLIAVARRLESVLRPGDTVARFGGDEFTILCEDLPGDSARARAVEIAQRLLTSVDRPFVVRRAETFVGVSIGIALSATGEESPDDLLRDADAAMYHAKDTGRGRVEVFDDTMRARALARHATENALHHAIERGELRLFFQPIVSLETARCVGAESVVRWQHPERGLVLPAEFVPLAEETGLIVPLGSWVLEQAAMQAARWQLETDDTFVVSVNLSARQMAEGDLADRVAAVLKSTGARPDTLCFEITETALMEDAEAMRRVIEAVRALGVQFSIDDFGTGYSSLGYLKRFAVDSVKIDRAFVDGIADDEGDRAIVSAVIGLAHALGLRVVAEGVEREAQLAELVALGCDEAQGYFFAPPQPADDLAQLVSRTRRWRPPGAPLMGRP